MADVYAIHLRTGCFCNVGACQRHLGLHTQQMKDNFKVKHQSSFFYILPFLHFFSKNIMVLASPRPQRPPVDFDDVNTLN